MRRALLNTSSVAGRIEFKLNDRVAWEIGGYVYTGEISRVKYAGEHSGIRIETRSLFSVDGGDGNTITVEDVFIPPSKLHLVRLISRGD